MPTPIPTPSPTRTPIVLAVVGLAGINCSEFDAAVYNEALMTILSNATMSEADCVFTGDSTAESVELTSEITMPLAIGLEAGYTVMDYVLSFLELSVSDGSFTAAIQVKAQCVRRTTSRYVHDSSSWPRPFARHQVAAAGRRRRLEGTDHGGESRERAWASVEHGGRVGHLALGQHVLADARAQPCANDGDANRFADRDVLADNGPDFRSCPAVLRAVRIQVGMRLSRQPSKSPLRRLSSDVLLVQGERPQLHAHHLHGRGAARRSARVLLSVSAGLQRPRPLFLYLRFRSARHARVSPRGSARSARCDLGLVT